MKYQKGNIGRVFIVKFDDGESPLEKLKEMAKSEGIYSAIFWLIGGLRKGRFVAGPIDEEMPPKPIWKEITGNNEILAIGTIFWFKEEPRIHLHGVYGREDKVKMGCLREEAEVFLILEAVVMEISHVNVKREFNEKSKMILLEV